MTNPANRGWVNVGFTDRDVEQRRRELSSATGVSHPFKVVHVFVVPEDAGKDAERLAHGALRRQRIRNRKEFFNCSAERAGELVAEALEEIMKARSIDVREVKTCLQSAWSRKKEVEGQLRNLKESSVAELSEIDRKYYENRQTKALNISRRRSGQLILNRLGATFIVVLVGFLAKAAFSPLVAFVLIVPLGLLWIPFTVLRL